MSHIVDDDPPIKTKAASQAYRDNWEKVFGDASGSSQVDEASRVAPETDEDANFDAIEMKVKLPRCARCGESIIGGHCPNASPTPIEE